jgi:hypothetical protein
MKTHRILTITTVTAILGACGGKAASNGEGGGVHTGLPGQKSLASLTPAEEEQLCRTTFDAMVATTSDPEMRRGLCVAFGGSLAGSKEACEVVAVQCDEEDTETDESSEDVECDTGRLAGCEATVSEYEACQSEILEWLNSLRDTTCDDIQWSTSNTPEGTADVMPACAALEEKCPSLAADEAASDDDWLADECSLELEVSGAYEGPIEVTGCGYGSADRPDAVSISFFTQHEPPLFFDFTLTTMSPGEIAASVPVSVAANPYDTPSWRMPEGSCVADVTAEACNTDDGNGVRYLVEAQCQGAAPAVGGGESLTFAPFSFRSPCTE